jgi:hypothetical protein
VPAPPEGPPPEGCRADPPRRGTRPRGLTPDTAESPGDRRRPADPPGRVGRVSESIGGIRRHTASFRGSIRVRCNTACVRPSMSPLALRSQVGGVGSREGDGVGKPTACRGMKNRPGVPSRVRAGIRKGLGRRLAPEFRSLGLCALLSDPPSARDRSRDQRPYSYPGPYPNRYLCMGQRQGCGLPTESINEVGPIPRPYPGLPSTP